MRTSTGVSGDPGSVERRGTGIATPSSRRRVDGVPGDGRRRDGGHRRLRRLSASQSPPISSAGRRESPDRAPPSYSTPHHHSQNFTSTSRNPAPARQSNTLRAYNSFPYGTPHSSIIFTCLGIVTLSLSLVLRRRTKLRACISRPRLRLVAKASLIMLLLRNTEPGVKAF